MSDVKPYTPGEFPIRANAEQIRLMHVDQCMAPIGRDCTCHVAPAREMIRRLYETARAGLADTERLDVVEEFLDDVDWNRVDAPKNQPVLKWFIGDGDPEFSNATTEAPTWRQAIDHFRELLAPQTDVAGNARSGRDA